MLSNELIKKIHIFSKYPNRSLEDFESLLGIHRRYILADIDRINDSLENLELPLLTFEGDVLKPISFGEKELCQALLPSLEDYVFQDERPDLIILYLLIEDSYLCVNHFESFLRVSRNSVLSDLKLVRKKLAKFDVSVHYSRQAGYYLEGSPFSLRRALEATINHLLSLASGKYLLAYLMQEVWIKDESSSLSRLLMSLGSKHHLFFISEKRKELAYLLAFLASSPFKSYVINNKVYRESSVSYQFSDFLEHLYWHFPQLRLENDFITTRLIGCIQGDLHHFYNHEVYLIMEEIIGSVLVNTGLVLNDSPNLRKNLYSHLLPAYYRILYDVEMVNPLKQQIQEDYASLFYLVKRSLLPLERHLKKPISDDEVSYFTIHFGSNLERPIKDKEGQLVALSLCPNGVSSSLILQSELRYLFPQIQFIEIHQLSDLAFLDESTYDMIFSTVAFASSKPVYVTQPLMGDVEKMMLKKTVCEDFNLPISNPVTINELLAIINRHTTIINKESLIRELSQYIIGSYLKKDIGGKGLLEILKEDYIQQCQGVSNWQEAIRLAAQPLIKEKIIEDSYIDGMIASVNELGAYIVLAPKVAVPHAAPDQGVNDLGIALLQLENPVSFDIEEKGDQDKDVQLIFVLAAVDSTSHLKALQELSLILDDDAHIEALIAADSKQKILDLMSQIIEEGDL